jgi:hypothetical protein
MKGTMNYITKETASEEGNQGGEKYC